MVKQKINIHSITEKAGKTGNKYFLIDTSAGTMSCFPDYKGLDNLRTAWANDIEIEVNVDKSQDGKFLNIRDEKKIKIYDNSATPFNMPVSGKIEEMSREKPERKSEGYESRVLDEHYPKERKSVNDRERLSGVKTPNGRKEFDKDPVGLAVEIFNTMMPADVEVISIKKAEAGMQLSIDLVKQAQEAFS